jgi:hypothetical protein
MEPVLLPERYRDKLVGMLNCYDRLIFTGTLPAFCYPEGMTAYLKSHGIRIFDYTKFAEPLREQIRLNAETIAKESGVEIEFVRKTIFRKESRIKQILEKRGAHPGLVHILSAMESRTSYRPWHDKKTGRTFLKYADGKCLHYYFYFIDECLGLCYLRVPTWCPFRLQFYCNGHSLLAHALRKKGIPFTMQDNAFLHIDDMAKANDLAGHLDIEYLHKLLDSFATRYCPVIQVLQAMYHWSIMHPRILHRPDLQTSGRPPGDLSPSPGNAHSLRQTGEHRHIPRSKLHGNYQGEMGNTFNVRLLGSRIKHTMGPASIKMYDKLALVLRIETTVNNVTFFKDYREVHHRHGGSETKWTSMRKTIYSLPSLLTLLRAANHRYLAFVSLIETPEAGVTTLQRITESRTDNSHVYKGFNPLADDDATLFRVLLRGEFCISGMSSRLLRRILVNKTAGQITRLLKRLRVPRPHQESRQPLQILPDHVRQAYRRHRH